MKAGKQIPEAVARDLEGAAAAAIRLHVAALDKEGPWHQTIVVRLNAVANFIEAGGLRGFALTLVRAPWEQVVRMAERAAKSEPTGGDGA